MKIAIIGSGLSGLATAWFVLNKISHAKVTLIDANGIGGGASGMAAGLMHPYSGASAKLNRFGLEGYAASLQLLTVASQALGKPVARYDGLLRLATTSLQMSDYYRAVERYPDLIWCEAKEYAFPGLFIKNCVTVDCQLYLEGLWKACELKGATFENSKIENLDQLLHFDQVVIAAGANVNAILGSLRLPIFKNKGQVLRMNWPKELKPLPYAINSHAYVVMDPSNETCSVGTTYEKQFESEDADLNFATQDILPKATLFLPYLQSAEIVGCRAGIRVVAPSHLPLIKKVNQKTWVITGMGSKGLLYHALYGEKLVDNILAG